MIFLFDFSVIKPDVGLLLWTTIFFLLFWGLIGKFAFRPIANALKKRENDIQNALDEAKRAKEEMDNMKSENEKLLVEARQERLNLLKEAKETKTAIINEAKDKAKEEAAKIVATSMVEIENQKKVALSEVKNQVGAMALDIAEKVIRKELAGTKDHESFVDSLVKELNL